MGFYLFYTNLYSDILMVDTTYSTILFYENKTGWNKLKESFTNMWNCTENSYRNYMSLPRV